MFINSLTSSEKFREATPEHVIKVERDSDGMFVGGFEGFGDDSKEVGSSRSSFLNADNNGRQGRRRSNHRRSSYNNDEFESDRGNGKKRRGEFRYFFSLQLTWEVSGSSSFSFLIWFHLGC